MLFRDFYKLSLLREASYWANSNENSLTGWISKDMKWIPVKSFHNHPKYIKALEPDLEPDIKGKKIPSESSYDPDQLEGQDEKLDICIDRGAVRVAEADLMGSGSDLNLQGNSLRTVNSALNFLYKNFPDDMVEMNDVFADVVSGGKTLSFKMDETGKLRKFEYSF